MQPLQHQCPRCSQAVPAGGSVCLHCLETDLADPAMIDLWSDGESDGESWQGFVLGEVLGSGGMGTVYRARQLHPAREVALKMLPMGLAGLESARLRLLAEAEALAELDHPGILPLYAAGEADGRAWLAMKLAGGGTLAQQMGEWQGRWREIAALVVSLAEAVQHAHGRGVIHRDLKPANILFDESGRAFVADFGLAKWLSGAHGQTLSAAVLGTPAYMAPEVAQQGAGAATTASDVYGLGAVMYELLTQRPPFSGPTPVETARRVVAEELTPPVRLTPDLPRDLAAIVLKAMQREPGRRYSSAQAMAEDLANWLAGRTITARHAGTAERVWRWCRRHPLPAGLAATVVAVTAVSAVMLWSAFTRTKQALKAAGDRVAFMTESLPARVEPLGRLDVLDDVFADVAAYYESMDSAAAPDPVTAHARRAAFQTQWAQILRRQGRLDEARAQSLTAVTAGEKAVALDAESPVACAALASAHRRLAELDILAAAFSTAFDHLTKAIAVLSDGLRAHPGDAGLVVERTDVLNEKAFGLLRSGNPEEALATFDTAAAGLPEAKLIAQTSPLIHRRHRELSLNSRSFRGEALLAAKRFPEAVANYTTHLADVTTACAAAPEDYQLESLRLIALNRLADAHARLPNPPVDRMAELWMQQEQGAAALCAHDPANLYWKAEWGMAALAVAHGADLQGDAAGSRLWLEKAMERLEEIPPRAHNEALEARANAALYLARNLHKASDWTTGRSRTLDAMDAALARLADSPDNFEIHEAFVSRMRDLLRIHHAHEPAGTAGLVEEWIARVSEESSKARGPASRWWKLTTASLHRRAADLHAPAEAAAENLKALTLRAAVCSEPLDAAVAKQVRGDVLSAAKELAKCQPNPDTAAAAVRGLLSSAPAFTAAGDAEVSAAVKALAELLPFAPAQRAELTASATAAFFPQPPAPGSPLAEAYHRLTSPP